MAKGPEAFRTISEAADELHVPQHVLRFWETKFSFIKPMKRAGGRRFYRPADIAMLHGVRRLLHDEGYTIKGVQKLHREHGLK
ncbi:MAG TPA: MerR family transcriptional regulator, partial [Phenylobacterium sp.]